MFTRVHYNGHVPTIPAAYLRPLVQAVRDLGAGPVFDNRASRADIFRKLGDPESASEAEREAEYVLAVFAS